MSIGTLEVLYIAGVLGMFVYSWGRIGGGGRMALGFAIAGVLLCLYLAFRWWSPWT